MLCKGRSWTCCTICRVSYVCLRDVKTVDAMICVEGRKKAGWLAVSAFQNVLNFLLFLFFLVLESVNNISDQMPQR